MDLATIFFREIVGSYDFDTDHEEVITRCTIAYMQESGIANDEIFKVMEACGEKKLIRPEDLPEFLWDGSLTEKDRYYCHRALQILSPASVIRKDGTFKDYPFYQEMRIRFTMQDLINYFYGRIGSNIFSRDDKRDAAQFNHLLMQFGKVEGISALDLVLMIIDDAAVTNGTVYEPFGLERVVNIQETAQRLKRTMAERHAKGYDQIVWRDYITEKGEITWQTTRTRKTKLSKRLQRRS